MSFFDKDSLWKHRNLGLIVKISDFVTVDGERAYLLGWPNAQDQAPEAKYLLRGCWTAEKLIREFTPAVESDRWDRLLDGVSALEEDAEDLPQGM